MFGSMRIWLLNLTDGSAAPLIDNPTGVQFQCQFFV